MSHQLTVLFSQNKSAIRNQSTILFSPNKPAPAISHESNQRTLRPIGEGGEGERERAGKEQEKALGDSSEEK
jgi:hypothetical protein